MRDALERWFGFHTFRPSQEAIVRDVLAGRDVFALLPTGGGKSLCYQLPAVLTSGLTVVISPLIALMKDQVDALDTAGIAGDGAQLVAARGRSCGAGSTASSAARTSCCTSRPSG